MRKVETPDTLSSFERRAYDFLRFVNERPGPKRVQDLYNRSIGFSWVNQCTKNILHVEGVERLRDLNPERGVLLCSNHRSFFDQYILSFILVKHAPWLRQIFFPVRSEFFYETVTGVALNLAVAGGAMYPPIFRDRKKAEWNKVAVERMVAFLQRPGAVVGVHPEGTRGKGEDPYTLLPAQPGAGEIALKSGAIVLPVWINGLQNDFVGQVRSNFVEGGRHAEPIIVSVGPVVDLGPLMQERARPALYKKISDAIMREVLEASRAERELRARLGSRP